MLIHSIQRNVSACVLDYMRFDRQKPALFDDGDSSINLRSSLKIRCQVKQSTVANKLRIYKTDSFQTAHIRFCIMRNWSANISGRSYKLKPDVDQSSGQIV